MRNPGSTAFKESRDVDCVDKPDGLAGGKLRHGPHHIHDVHLEEMEEELTGELFRSSVMTVAVTGNL